MRGKGFTFKQFHINHSRCAMKVGTDGTLLGAWASLPDSTRNILDIGTGTGLIAIMAAQRHPNAQVCAIDIDSDCISQAEENVAACPWSERIKLYHSPLQEFMPQEKFDVIIDIFVVEIFFRLGYIIVHIACGKTRSEFKICAVKHPVFFYMIKQL